METMVGDAVTGATTEVELVVDLPVDRVWELITDVNRFGQWSPECVYSAWRPAQGSLPRAGARFDARNEYADGFVAAVECVATEVVHRSVFEWVVLDEEHDPARPGSIWRHEIEPGPHGRGTRLRHRFTHGPGLTGLRAYVRDNPERGRSALDGRLAELRTNMSATLGRMMRCAAYPARAAHPHPGSSGQA